jgi:hypothetical protein
VQSDLIAFAVAQQGAKALRPDGVHIFQYSSALDRCLSNRDVEPDGSVVVAIEIAQVNSV